MLAKVHVDRRHLGMSSAKKDETEAEGMMKCVIRGGKNLYSGPEFRGWEGKTHEEVVVVVGGGKN